MPERQQGRPRKRTFSGVGTPTATASVMLLPQKPGVEPSSDTIAYIKQHQMMTPRIKLWFSIFFLSGVFPVYAQQIATPLDDPASVSSASLSFDRHVTNEPTKCWEVTTFQALDEDGTDTILWRATDLVLQNCEGKTAVVDLDDNSNKELSRFGEVTLGQDITISFSGSREDNMVTPTDLAVIVVQLCPIGINSVCAPIIPDPAFMTATESKTTRNNDGMFDFVIISGEEKFLRQVSLRPPKAGIYSLLGSLIVFYDETAGSETVLPNFSVRGASTVPFVASSGQEQFIIVHPASIPPQAEEALIDGNDDIISPAVVEDWAVSVVIAFSVVGGLALLSLLAAGIYYRKAQVFELSQGKFLMAMLLSGLVAVSSLILLEPRNDTYCRLFQPLVTLPMHIMFSILIGRMWRIRAIISPLLLLTLEKREHWTTHCVNFIEKLTRYEGISQRMKVSDKKIRRTITDHQLLKVIFALCMPQMIVQILLAALVEQGFFIDYDNPSIPNGYATCSPRFFNEVLSTLAFTFVLIQFFLLLILAGTSRDLPSLFNETQNIWDIALVAFRMTLAGGLLVGVTYNQPSAPTALYLVLALLTGVTIVHTCVRITWTKIIAARKGNKIAVTKLIAAHNRTTRVSQESVNVRPAYDVGQVGAKADIIYGDATGKTQTLPSTTEGNSSALVSSNLERRGPIAARTDLGLDIGLETLEEEEEVNSRKKSTDNAGSSRILMMEDDESDAVSTGSSVVMTTMQQKNEESPFPSGSMSMELQLPRSRRLDDPPRLSQDIPLQNSLASGLTMGSSIQRKSRRTLFQRNASKATIESLELDATTPPPLLMAQSDSIVPTSNMTRIPRPTSSMNRQKSLWRLSFLAGSSEKTGPGKSNDLISASEGSDRDAHRPRRKLNTVPLTIEYNPKTNTSGIHVVEGDPPPRRLLLRMIDVQRCLARANQDMLSGIGLTQQEWEDMRERCVSLGEVFSSDVCFDWEEEKATVSNSLQIVQDKDSGVSRSSRPSSLAGESSSGHPPPSFPIEGFVAQSDA